MIERKLIYQGGIPIGYFENGTAVIDSEFWGGDSARSYARQGAKLSFEPGLAQRLNAEEKEKPLPRRVRIHQLKPQATQEKKFIPYSLLCERFGAIDPEDYQVVFDGQLGTEDLNKLRGLLEHSFPLLRGKGLIPEKLSEHDLRTGQPPDLLLFGQKIPAAQPKLSGGLQPEEPKEQA